MQLINDFLLQKDNTTSNIFPGIYHFENLTRSKSFGNISKSDGDVHHVRFVMELRES